MFNVKHYLVTTMKRIVCVVIGGVRYMSLTLPREWKGFSYYYENKQNTFFVCSLVFNLTNHWEINIGIDMTGSLTSRSSNNQSVEGVMHTIELIYVKKGRNVQNCRETSQFDGFMCLGISMRLLGGSISSGDVCLVHGKRQVWPY